MKKHSKATTVTRRELLTVAAALPGAALLARLGEGAALAAPAVTAAPGAIAPATDFAFPLLGDLHYDKLEHHDMEWLAREKPNDVRQVQNYSRIAEEVAPQLLAEVRLAVAAQQHNGLAVPFVMHMGDLVEGLCGTPALAQKQSEEAVAWVRAAKLGAPFLFAKGNHDITGPGAPDAYKSVFLPFLSGELRQVTGTTPPLANAYYSFEQGNALFCFFDAYDEASLAWLEVTLAGRGSKQAFVIIHPPVVPYGARATWHQYSRSNQAQLRERLLNVLGQHSAIVLGGHIHKYSVLSRRTTMGRFVQVALSSVLPKAEVQPKDVLEGAASYTPDQIRVEPNFSPDSEAARRAVLAAEAPFIEHFEYADAPGYAVIAMRGQRVEAQIYRGLGQQLWKTIDLSALLHEPKQV